LGCHIKGHAKNHRWERPYQSYNAQRTPKQLNLEANIPNRIRYLETTNNHICYQGKWRHIANFLQSCALCNSCQNIHHTNKKLHGQSKIYLNTIKLLVSIHFIFFSSMCYLSTGVIDELQCFLEIFVLCPVVLRIR
jgi:hypothetical protein